ncbi:MAG: MBOAT family protein, partial [Planctomycetota bacterium]|nr:MBOAT family protein [Planctomycetota bacterium]
NLMTTMLLGGLWHGAGWTFVFWGGLHGLYLCVNHGWQKWCKRADWQFTHRRSWQPVAWTITFVAVLVGWVYFRAASFMVANSIIASMFGLNGFDLDVKGSNQILYVLAVLAAAVWLPNTQQIMDRHSPCSDWDQLRGDASPVPSRLAWIRWNPGTLSAALTATAAALGVLSLTRVQEFLYFQF